MNKNCWIAIGMTLGAMALFFSEPTELLRLFGWVGATIAFAVALWSYEKPFPWMRDAT